MSPVGEMVPTPESLETSQMQGTEISLEDPQSVEFRLSAAIMRAKVEALQEQGFKALPLSATRFRKACYGPAQALFHLCSFQTSYDFTKISRLHVDGDNTQEIVDPTKSEQCSLRAVPVVLQPANLSSMKFVFVYIYKERCPLVNWVLENVRGSRTTLISYTADLPQASPEGDAAQQRCSMYVFPGSPEEVYATWSAARACSAKVETLNTAEPPGKSTSTMNYCPSTEFSMALLKAVWAKMTVNERVQSMSFGKDLQALVSRCHTICGELGAATRMTASLGLHTGFKDLALVPALEFVPGHDRSVQLPAGMMFSAALVLRPDTIFGTFWPRLSKVGVLQSDADCRKVVGHPFSSQPLPLGCSLKLL